MSGFASQILNTRIPFSYANMYEVDVFSPITRAQIIPIEIESVTAPGMGITTMDIPLQGWRHSVKFPVNLAFEDISLNLRLTEDFYLYDFFKEWMNLVVQPGKFVLNYADKYEGSITIHSLNRKRERIKSITYEGAYPIALSDLQMSSASENAITPLAVTLTYASTPIIQ